MRTAATAIAWEFQKRHRWGLSAALATILLLGAIKIAVLTTKLRPELNAATLGALVPIPLAASFLYLLAVFAFGISGDLAARESMYPPRMLTLPVSSRALAGWPMLFGCVAMALWWPAMRIACVFPPRMDVPKYWPALFAASVLAWTQALTWTAYPFRGMRIVVSTGLLVSIDIVVFTALEYKASESTMLLLLSPLVPLAYAAASTAVGRARRGEVPEWPLAKRFAVPFLRSAAPREFSSAAGAQFWFEWRQFGRSLPILVAMVLPFGLSMLFLFRETPAIIVAIIVASLLVPPFMATFVAATVGKSNANASGSHGIAPFLAARPLEDRALVAAKWKAALLSTLEAWVIVAIAVPAALLWSDTTAPIADIARTVDGALGRPRAIILALLVLAGLAASTWKQLVQGLYIAMSGREWAVKGIVFATLLFLTAGAFLAAWIVHSRYRFTLAVSAIPWVMTALVAIKLALAMRLMQRGAESGFFSRTQLIAAATAWDVCVLAVYGGLTLILPDILVRRHFLLLVAMLFVPFVRLLAAPLAVAGNRHR